MQATPCDPTKVKLGRALKHDSPAIACRFDPSGKYVFFAAEDSRVWRWIWDGDTKVPLAAHDSWVRALAFDPGGETLITGGYDGRLIWWPAAAEKPEPIRTVEAHAGWIRALAVSPDGQLLASVGNDKLVRLWNLADGQPVRELAGHTSHIYNVAFHPDGLRLVTGDLKGGLFEWQVADGGRLRELSLPALHKYDTTFQADIGGPRGMAFRPDGQRLACAGITAVTNAFAGVGNPVVEVVDWEAGKPVVQHGSKAKLRGVAWAVRYHPDGFLIGVSGGGGGGFVLFWKDDQADEFHQFKLPNSARDLDLHPDGRHLVTAHVDGHIRILDM